jgi:nicotinate phosphoribosyltransferase
MIQKEKCNSLHLIMVSFQQHAGLYTDYYELTMAQGYFLTGMHEKRACFDYFFRKLPFKGGYVVFAGLQDLLDVLRSLQFQPEDIAYLRSCGFDKRFLDYLSRFRFKGTLHSVAEGEIIFPNEPVLRAEGTILETQIIETLTLNFLNFQSLIATKASRLKFAAGDRMVIDFGLRRAQGLGGIHASRAAVIGGIEATSNVFSAYAYDLKPSGTMAHSWVESFDSELEAFRQFARIFPENSIFLVDTYDTLQSGIPHAITVAYEMKQKGHSLKGVRLDSGDFAYLSKHARAMLDQAGLPEVKIVASNQLDEHIIKSLEEQGARIDIFGVGTNLVIGREDAALDGVYKLSEYNGQPKIKISENIEKILIPRVKKISRYYDREGKFYADAVTAVNEGPVDVMIHPHQSVKRLSLKGLHHENLLHEVMREGEVTMKYQSPYEIAAYAKQRLNLLPDEHKRFEYPHIYKVGVSASLLQVRDQLISEKLVKPDIN